MRVLKKGFLKQSELRQLVLVLSARDACTSQKLCYLIQESIILNKLVVD